MKKNSFLFLLIIGLIQSCINVYDDVEPTFEAVDTSYICNTWISVDMYTDIPDHKNFNDTLILNIKNDSIYIYSNLDEIIVDTILVYWHLDSNKMILYDKHHIIFNIDKLSSDTLIISYPISYYYEKFDNGYCETIEYDEIGKYTFTIIFILNPDKIL